MDDPEDPPPEDPHSGHDAPDERSPFDAPDQRDPSGTPGPRPGDERPGDAPGGPSPRHSPHHRSDSGSEEFGWLILDDDFVAGATIHEPSASERSAAVAPSGYHRYQDPFDLRLHDEPEDLGDDEILHLRSQQRRRRRGRIVKTIAALVVVATLVVYGLDHFVNGFQLLPWSRVDRALTGNEPPPGSPAASPPPQATPDDDADADGGQPGDDTAARPPTGTTPEGSVRIIRGDDWPPAPKNPSTERVLPAVVPTTSGPHRFIMTQEDGSGPVAYDPCRPIHYVVSGASKAPLEGQRLIDESIASVSRHTGLLFVDDGTTTERPSEDRRAYQPGRYGERWAPVLIAWSDPVESPRLAESFDMGEGSPQMDVLGYAGSYAVGLRTVSTGGASGTDGTGGGSAGAPRDGMIFVTGGVTLDGPDFASLLQIPGGYEIARSAIMHELAHLVGLAHVDDPAQLMYPALQPGVTDFGGGDLEGLAAVGSGPCMPEI